MKKITTINISPVKKYSKLYLACQKYPQIQLQVNSVPVIINTNNNKRLVKNKLLNK